MTNKLKQITILALATILLAGGAAMTQLAYSTGSDDDDDDDHDKKDNCECKKPTKFTVTYSGPGSTDASEVKIEVYKDTKDIGKKTPLLTIPGILQGDSVTVDSNVYGKQKIESNTVYRVLQNGVQIAVVSIHTSCSQPLFIGKVYTNGPVSLTVKSGSDYKGKQSIFLEHDPICEGATLKVKKVVVPNTNDDMFTLQIVNAQGVVANSEPLGDGGTLGPQLLTVGTYTVSETGTNLANYKASFSGDCDKDGKVNLEKGDQAVCIITNTEKIPASITLKKTIMNDNGGTATATSFAPYKIKNVVSGNEITLIEGVKNENIPAGTYTLTETNLPAYSFVLIAGDTPCPAMLDTSDDDSDEFTLEEGQHITCTIYNNDNGSGSTGGDGIFFARSSVSINIDTDSTFSETNSMHGCAKVMPPEARTCVTTEEGFLLVVDQAFEQNGAEFAAIVYTVQPDQGNPGVAQCTSVVGIGMHTFPQAGDMGADLDVRGFLLDCNLEDPGNYNINYAIIKTDPVPIPP